MRRDEGGRDTVLASLGALYASGQSVAWNRLHPRGGRLVSAPTYPWQRERFWLDTAAPGTSARPVADESPWRGPIRSSAQPNTVLCEIDVSTDLLPILNDHRVHGSVVVPGATLLELVVAGTARALGAPRRMPRNVSFHRSLVLDGAQRRTVQLVLRGSRRAPPPSSYRAWIPLPRALRRGRCWRAARWSPASRRGDTAPHPPKTSKIVVLKRFPRRRSTADSRSTVWSTGRRSKR